jgi:hypothetical protein
MNQPAASKSPVILLTFALLLVYNALYWPGKLLHWPEGFYPEIAKHWKLITFIEFLAVASLAVDIIVQFDRFPKREAQVRVITTAVIGALLVLRFILGVMDMYMRGEVGG